MSDSSRPHGLQPTRLLHPWDFPGKVLEWGAIAFSKYLPGVVYKTQSFLVEEGREGGEMWGRSIPVCFSLLPVYPTAEEFLTLLPAKPVRIHTSPLLWPPFSQSEIISSLLTCFHLCPLQWTSWYNIRPIFQQCSQTTLPSM